MSARAGTMSSEGMLAGIRVLDLTSIVVGPVCTLRLADYGAEIIKLEPPGGDLLRSLGGASPSGQHSGTYLHLNRGKRSLCLDLKHPAGRAAAERLIDSCDVVVSNIRPVAMARLGLDAATVRATRPRLIYCTITGFGPDGPYRGKPAYDIVIQGASGIGGVYERRQGTPAYVPFVMCDHVVGEIAAGAVMGALVQRGRTGVGGEIEVPMFETMASFVLHEHLAAHSFEPPVGPIGDQRILSADNLPIRTADGWLSLTSNTDAQTQGLLRAIGREDLIADLRFATVAARMRNITEWYRIRNAAFGGRTTSAWVEILDAQNVPAMPCHSLDSLLTDPHLAAVGLLGTRTHSSEGEVRTIRPTVIENGVVPPAGTLAGPLGSETRGILEEIGMLPAEIDALLLAGAAFMPE
ncbi:MAG: CaiB/BaiF CoA transferase family protein [Janthinobacterium lividum]